MQRILAQSYKAVVYPYNVARKVQCVSMGRFTRGGGVKPFRISLTPLYIKCSTPPKFCFAPHILCDRLFNTRPKKKYLWFWFHIVKKLGSVGRKQIFFEYFFMGLVVFCWGIFSRVPTSILTRDTYFIWTNLGNLVQ